MSRVAAIQPRCFSREDAAAYCGCDSLSAFDSWVRKGIVPRPIPGTQKWDRFAIDDALDRFRASSPSIQADPYLAWKAEQDANAR
jgi:hypothetical protein